jgi:prepilin-type N-terminal cleavage/methylation domain-containing protein
MFRFVNVARSRKGFTLVELAVVIVIIGVLAAFGVPQFLKSVERSKAAEAFAYLSDVRAAQERFQALRSTYTNAMDQLDMKISAPKYFTASSITAGTTGTFQDSWSLTLTRTGASSGYGAYTVTFTQDGYDISNSTIRFSPDINPMGN